MIPQFGIAQGIIDNTSFARLLSVDSYACHDTSMFAEIPDLCFRKTGKERGWRISGKPGMEEYSSTSQRPNIIPRTKTPFLLYSKLQNKKHASPATAQYWRNSSEAAFHLRAILPGGMKSLRADESLKRWWRDA
ncbi:hypothetical protein NPIL_684061 [Nephila pilipes]|uniref:Uncharacterized protein n=1 Tax=Nephila pilipes TaxID=299642 RepID=A0A8X6Q5N7_NEPPI|nr:hypothetical protein NPIL_684061 [Nephila pilipes]